MYAAAESVCRRSASATLYQPSSKRRRRFCTSSNGCTAFLRCASCNLRSMYWYSRFKLRGISLFTPGFRLAMSSIKMALAFEIARARPQMSPDSRHALASAVRAMAASYIATTNCTGLLPTTPLSTYALYGSRNKVLPPPKSYRGPARLFLAHFSGLVRTKRTGRFAGRCARLTKRTGRFAGRCAPLTKPTGRFAGRCARLTKRTGRFAGRCARLTNPTGRLAGRCARLTKPTGRFAGRCARLTNPTGRLAGRCARSTREAPVLADVIEEATRRAECCPS